MRYLASGSISLTVQITWLAIALGVPLAVNPLGYNSFELPKVVLLRSLVLVMGIATLLPLLSKQNRPQSLRIPPLFFPALAYFLVFFGATLFSADFRRSLFGSFERQQGLLTIFAYFILFLVIATHLTSRASMERLWKTVVWGSTPVVAYGLLQVFGFDPLAWRNDAASSVFSTLGRSNFFASYLIMVIPLTAGKLVLTRNRIPLVLLLIGQIICLVFTQARGAWLGMAIAGLILALAWSAFTTKRRPILVGLTIAVFTAGSLGFLSVSGAVPKDLPGIARLTAAMHTDEGATAARLTIWRSTLPLIIERPFFGNGPETMGSVYARVFPPQLVYYQGREAIVDRAHNLWLDTALNGGLLGATAAAALFIRFFLLARRELKEATDRWTQIAWVALAAAVGGHLVDLQFGFDLTASSTAFWLLLGFASALARKPEPAAESRTLPGIVPVFAGAIVTIILLVFLCGRPLLADLAYGRSQPAVLALSERIQYACDAIETWPIEPRYRLGLSWLYLQNGNPIAAEAQLDAADRLSPGDPIIWSARGELYATWGQKDRNRLPQAEAAYRRAIELAPNVAAYHTALGLVLARLQNPEMGTAELERAIALDTTDSTAYRYLADLYLASGKESEAMFALAQAAKWAR